MCPFDKLRSPLELNGIMKYDDFTVKLDFKPANSVMTTKMDDSSFRIDGNGFGFITYDDKQYAVERVFVKSPSDHKIEGSYLHGELQVVATSGSERIVLAKLLQEVPTIVAGYQQGMSQFGFGKNQLKWLRPKLLPEAESKLRSEGRAAEIGNSSFFP